MATEDFASTDLPLSTSDVKQQVRLRLGKGHAGIPPRTVFHNFDETVARVGDKPALHQKRMKKGQPASEVGWTTWTWKEYREQVNMFGKALLSLKFKPFDVINIIGFNSPEWFFANFGAMAAGGVSSGIYATNLPEACKYISEHSKAKVVVCEGLKQLEKYYEISHKLKHLKALVVYGLPIDANEIPEQAKKKCRVPVFTYEEFCKLGEGVSDDELKERTEGWKPGNSCTLIYTSGTTGNPKAVMITQDNITWTVTTMMKAFPRGYLYEEDMMISYLPLSHIAAQMLDMHNPMQSGCQIYFAQPDALKGSLGATLKDVRPTVFFGVPRVWEKIYEKMQEVAKSTTGITKVISTWAKGEALAYWESMEYDALQSFSFTRMAPISYLAAQVLLSKVRVALGLDRCIACYVSAAPIEVKILKYFMSVDIPILELFGQSECTGPHAVNMITAMRVGTVGRPMLGTETRIVEGTGELTYRGRHIFAGYMNQPDKTKETIDEEGWLHSGDIVSVDEYNNEEIPAPSGFLKITGRIKELIITAGGENIPPVAIEDQLKAAMPALSNAMVIGDKRKFLTVLFCLKVEIDIETGEASTILTEAARSAVKDSDAKTTEEVMKDPSWHAYFDNGIIKANSKATSNAQRVGKWTLLPTDFTEKGGELTPTLKLKRSVTADKYKKAIETMYS